MLSLQVLVCPACFSDEITANIARDRLQQILADAWSRPFADKTKKADQPSVVKRCERDRLVDIFGTAYATLLALRANSLPELGVPWCIISSNLDSLHDLLTSLDKDAPARFEKELPKA
jgi:hypothetical protein